VRKQAKESNGGRNGLADVYDHNSSISTFGACLGDPENRLPIRGSALASHHRPMLIGDDS
jgi:hypothetical protein